MFKRFVFMICLLPFALYAENFVVGKDYQLIQSAADVPVSQKKVVVTEFFSYGCPWCYRIEPALSQWVKQQGEHIAFAKVPVIFNKDWAYYAKAYYTANLLGVDTKLNPLLFKAIQGKQTTLNNDDAMIEFFTKQGIDKATAESAFKNSTTIDMQVNHGVSLMTQYRITGVPAIVINNRYKTDLQMAQGEERLLKIMTFLVNQAHQKE